MLFPPPKEININSHIPKDAKINISERIKKIKSALSAILIHAFKRKIQLLVVSSLLNILRYANRLC